MQVFELTLAGFDASSSDTDDLIVWVAAQASQSELVQQLSAAGLYPTKVTAVEVLPAGFEAELQCVGNFDALNTLIDTRLRTARLDSPIGKAIAALQLACQNPGDPNFSIYKEALTSLVETRVRILRLEKRVSDREICPGGDEYSELLGLVGLYMPPSARLVRMTADLRILGLVPDPQSRGSYVSPVADHIDCLRSNADDIETIDDASVDVSGAEVNIPIQSGVSSEAIEQPSTDGKGPFVRDRVDMAIWSELAPAVADLEEDTVVGLAVVGLLTQLEISIKAQTRLEAYNVEQLKEIGVDQCHVWFYG